MALHNAEHDMVRINAVLESVAQVHPAMTNHIVAMQPEFGFKNRELAELAKVAVENDAKAVKRRKLAEERALEDLARAKQILADAETDLRRKLANKAIDEAQAELDKVRQEAVDALKVLGVTDEALDMATALRGGGAGAATEKKGDGKDKPKDKPKDPKASPDDLKRSATAPASVLAEGKEPLKAAAGTSKDDTNVPSVAEDGEGSVASGEGEAADAEAAVQRAHTMAVPGEGSPSRRASDPLTLERPSSGGEGGEAGGRARFATMPPQIGAPAGGGLAINIPTAQGSTLPTPGGPEESKKVKVVAAPSPMGKIEAEALSRMQFCLKQSNFKDIRQLAGTQTHCAGLYCAVLYGIDCPVLYCTVPRGLQPAARTQRFPTLCPTLTPSIALTPRSGEDLFAFDNDSITSDHDHSDEEEDESKDPYEVISKHETTIDALREEITALYGTFEFLRTGNSNALPARCVNQWLRHEKDKTGGYAGRNWDQLTRDGDQGGHTWNDFLLQIRAKMPGTRKTITVEEKMSRRITDSYSRSLRTQAGLYGKDKTTFAVNPYAMQPIDDDFKPGTPREWAHELNETDVVLTPGDLYKTMSYGTPNNLFASGDDDGTVSVHSHGESTV